MPTVDILESAVRVEFDQDHGGIFLHILLADVAIGHFGDVGQRLAGKQHPVEQALQRGGKDSRRYTLAGDVGDHDIEAFLGSDYVVEIAADLLTGNAARVHLGIGQVGNGELHQPLLDGGGDVQFFPVA